MQMSAGWRLESAVIDGDVFEASVAGDALVNVLSSNASLLIGCGGCNHVFGVTSAGVRATAMALGAIADVGTYLGGLREGVVIDDGAIKDRHVADSNIFSHHIADSNVLPCHISDFEAFASGITRTAVWQQRQSVLEAGFSNAAQVTATGFSNVAQRFADLVVYSSNIAPSNVLARHIAQSNVFPYHISDFEAFASGITNTNVWQQQVVADSDATGASLSNLQQLTAAGFSNAAQQLAATILAEATSRASEDASLQTQITANTNGLTAEVTNRTTADTGLQGQITALTGNLATEVTARTTADGTSASNLATEVTNRTTADTGLQGQITGLTTTITTNLATEVTERTTADTGLQGQITTMGTQVAALTASDATESTARALIATNLAAEVTARTSADTGLQGQITTMGIDLTSCVRVAGGSVLTGAVLGPVTTNVADLGTTEIRFRDAYLSGTLRTGAALFSSNLGVTQHDAVDMGSTAVRFRTGYFSQNLSASGTVTAATVTATTMTKGGVAVATVNDITSGFSNVAQRFADLVVYSSNIADSNVLTRHIADSNVLARHIAASNVRLTHLADVTTVPLGGTGLSNVPAGEIPFGGGAGALRHAAALMYDASNSNVQATNVTVAQRAHVGESVLIGQAGGVRYRMFVGATDGDLRMSKIEASGDERFFLNMGDLERLLTTVMVNASVSVLVRGGTNAVSDPYLVDGQAYADYLMRRGVVYTFSCTDGGTAGPLEFAFLDSGGAAVVLPGADLAAVMSSGAITAVTQDGVAYLAIDMGYGRAALNAALGASVLSRVVLRRAGAGASAPVFTVYSP